MNASLLTRRMALAGLATSPLVAAASASAAESLRAGWFAKARSRPGLARGAAAKGILFGTAVQAVELNDPTYRAVLERDAQLLTAENELKWGVVHPELDRYDFSRADRIFEYTRANGMAMRGHNLVWHISLPGWFAPVVHQGNVRSILAGHIKALCTHYAGKLHSWDVVNEPIHVKDGNAGGLRETPFLRLLGPDYIDFAFETAAAADPTTPLVLNEMGVEMDDGYCADRRKAVLQLLRRLKSNNIPIHALGIESHLVAADSPFDSDIYRRFLGQVADLGLDIYITEMDIADYPMAADPIDRDEAVADLYGRYLAVALMEPAVKSVQTWGLSDRYTWLTNSEWTRRRDRSMVRGCLYDDTMQPVAAYGTVAVAFQRAPSRASDR